MTPKRILIILLALAIISYVIISDQLERMRFKKGKYFKL